MKKDVLAGIALAITLVASARAQITTIRTLPGGTTTQLQYNNGFSFSGAAGSAVSSAGLVTVRDSAVTYGLSVTTLTATGLISASSITLAGNADLTLSGASGYLTSASSITASAFFGSGAALTGIPSTSSISGVYAPLSGATFTGAVAVTGTSVTANAFFGSGAALSGVLTGLTGPVTSVGNATTIVGPVPTSAVDLSTVTTALALKADLAGAAFTGAVTVTPAAGAGDFRVASGDNSGTLLRFENTSGTDFFFDTRGAFIHMAPPSGNGLLLNTSGNVGIGTVSPLSRLHVYSTTDKTGIDIENSVQQPTLRFKSPRPVVSASERDWSATVSHVDYGDFHLRVSSAATADPLASAGISSIVIARTGIVSAIAVSSMVVAGHEIFGVWYTWAPTWGGFSTLPTGVGKYMRMGKTIFLRWRTENSPVSNANTLTATMPCTSNWSGSSGIVGAIDNDIANVGIFYPTAGSATTAFYYTAAASAWTTSGGKALNFTVTMECQ